MPGCKPGPGNPRAQQTARIREAIFGAMTDEKTRAIAERLVDMAVGGDLAAVREVLNRTVGVPVASDVLQRLERLESLLLHSENKQ